MTCWSMRVLKKLCERVSEMSDEISGREGESKEEKREGEMGGRPRSRRQVKPAESESPWPLKQRGTEAD